MSYRVVVGGGEREVSFCYFSLALARLNYKAILLGLYRKKALEGFAICLNRYKDAPWRDAIFREAGGLPGRPWID